MCSSQKREQNNPPDPVQSLPQDQCQAGRHQQHPSAKYSVSMTHGHSYDLFLLHCQNIFSKEHYTKDTRVILKNWKYKCTFWKENIKVVIFKILFWKNFIGSSVFMNMNVNNLARSDRNYYMTWDGSLWLLFCVWCYFEFMWATHSMD